MKLSVFQTVANKTHVPNSSHKGLLTVSYKPATYCAQAVNQQESQNKKSDIFKLTATCAMSSLFGSSNCSWYKTTSSISFRCSSDNRSRGDSEFSSDVSIISGVLVNELHSEVDWCRLTCDLELSSVFVFFFKCRLVLRATHCNSFSRPVDYKQDIFWWLLIMQSVN